MTMEGFLQDVICELAEPSLLVDREKRIVFATKSFEALIGKLPDGHKCKCTQFVIPSLSERNNKDACCWDVLDIYLHKGTSALWPLTRQDGSFFPTLCTVSPIRIGSSLISLIAIFVRPLLGIPAKSSLAFFQAARRNLDTLGAYEEYVRAYLRKNHVIKQVIWLDTDSAGPAPNGNSLKEHLTEAAIAAQSKVPTDVPFDVVVRTGRDHDVFHLFPSTHTPKGKILAVQAAGRLNEPTVCELLAVVAAAVTQPASDQASWLKTSVREAFSVRENQILALVAGGMSDREIALRLNLSPYTVRNHMRHMMGKAGAKKRTQLVALR